MPMLVQAWSLALALPEATAQHNHGMVAFRVGVAGSSPPFRTRADIGIMVTEEEAEAAVGGDQSPVPPSTGAPARRA